MDDAELWLCPEQLFDGRRLRRGLALGLANGTTTRTLPVQNLDPAARRRHLPGILTPGFLDLQVNGGGGVLFNTSPSPDGIAAIAAAHRRFGTVGILVTVITDRPEVLDKAVQAAIQAKGQPGFLGIHIEGPHLSVARRGTHSAAFIRPLDDGTIAHVARLRAARIPVMITLAPESATPEQVATLARLGAVISIGHSDATAEEVKGLLDAGAGCFTHLYNAMSPMLNRTPGVTGACINSTAYAGIICDGIHVADDMVALAIRARPVPDRMFLVSDAMPTVGGPDRFSLYGDEIHLEQGRLVNAEGSLAGAHVTMAESLARLVNRLHIAPDVALRMAVTVPAAVLRRPVLSRPTFRSAEDLVLLASDWSYRGSLAQSLA